MQQVASDVYRLGSRSHNWYLVFEADQVSVIDAGCAREWSKLLRALAAHGIDVDQIAGFMITHVHSDHFGMARRATDEDLRVAVHVGDEPRALGVYEGRFAVQPSELPVHRPRVIYTFLPMLAAGVTSLDHVEHVETFESDQVLDVPGRPVAIHTPGHTEGHTMFHCPDLGILFTGDGMITMDLLGSSKGPQMIGDLFNVDTAQALASLDRVSDIEADLMLPGHGDPWHGSPGEAVARIRSDPAVAD